MNTSEYYLERVGLETKIRLRLNLKNGKNVIGRAARGASNDFNIDSPSCSALHCVITVSDGTVKIENKSKSNGTTVNMIKMTDEIIQLKLGDIIGIVRGVSVPWNLTGNYGLFVYKLCKYTSENPLTLELDDDETYSVSDETLEISDEDDVIILDPIDVKVEHDLNIALSRDRNAAIKKELEDNDKSETLNKPIKQEHTNFFEIETIDIDSDEPDDIGTFDPQLPIDNFYPEAPQSESIYSTGSLQENEVPRSESNKSSDNSDEHWIILDENATIDLSTFFPTHQHMSISAPTHQHEGDRTVKTYSRDAKVIQETHSEEETIENVRLFVERDMENVKRKEGSEISEPKQVEKRQKKTPDKGDKGSERTQKVNTEQSTENPKRKEKSKIASTSAPGDVIKKTQSTAKVKYTKDNRGSFLTDPTQIPGLPKPVTERRKSTIIVGPLPTKLPSLPSEGANVDCSEVDDGSKSDNAERYASNKIKKVSFKDLQRPAVDESPSSSLADKSIEPDTPQSDTTFNENFASPSYVDLQASIDKKMQEELKPKEPHRKSVFQMNPCHDIISILTSYDAKQFNTVDTFCRSVNQDFKSLGDTYKDTLDYQETILPLIMLDLYKEIELEYLSSVDRDFIAVLTTDQNLERRGKSQRMVFHCQVDFPSDCKCLFEGHLVLARCNVNKLEFLAMVTDISYIRETESHQFAHFTLETSFLTKLLPVYSLQIRYITVISNTLNAFRSIYNLEKSPLLELLLNPLSSVASVAASSKTKAVQYKGYDQHLDTDQLLAVKEIYKRCKNLNVPNISLLDGAAGTGKSNLICNLALQLVYGDSLPRPLRILICSRSNRNIDEITKKLLHVRDKTKPSQKIHLVRYGVLDRIDPGCRCVSVQHMKENEQSFIQWAKIDKLEEMKSQINLKLCILRLDETKDKERRELETKMWKTKLIRINTLIARLEAIDRNKREDATTVLLNACDIICTTLGSIARLQSYVPYVDVCIFDEASQCNESLTLLPFRFGMPSLVLVGDSGCPPPMVFSEVAYEKNYGNSLFGRCHKLFAETPGSPIFRLNIQHRMHSEIFHWPNAFFYNNRLTSPDVTRLDSLEIVPYRVLSYGCSGMVANGVEWQNILSVADFVNDLIDTKKYSVRIICTNSTLKYIMGSGAINRPYIKVSSANETHLVENDVTILWISKDNGIGNLCNGTLFNRAITRARRCLLICGADLMSYKSRPAWKSILEDAQRRKCFVHMKKFLPSRLDAILRKKTN